MQNNRRKELWLMGVKLWHNVMIKTMMLIIDNDGDTMRAGRP